eukprot:UN08741
MILSHSLLQQPTLYNDKYNKSPLLILILLCIIYCITFQDTDPIVIIIQLTTVIKLVFLRFPRKIAEDECFTITNFEKTNFIYCKSLIYS